MTKVSENQEGNNANTVLGTGLSEKEQFVQKLKDKIKNAKNEGDKQYLISVGKELFFDWNYVG